MIHTPENTPPSDVFVDGIRVDSCFYADTELGIAKRYTLPLRVSANHQTAVSHTLHGVVTVEARS
jgi:hypothetical protein